MENITTRIFIKNALSTETILVTSDVAVLRKLNLYKPKEFNDRELVRVNDIIRIEDIEYQIADIQFRLYNETQEDNEGKGINLNVGGTFSFIADLVLNVKPKK